MRPWWHRAAAENSPRRDADEVKVRAPYSCIDSQVSRIPTALDAAGLAENTVVICNSDHRDWLAGHGPILKGTMPYEGLLRVPTLVKGPCVQRGK